MLLKVVIGLICLQLFSHDFLLVQSSLFPRLWSYNGPQKVNISRPEKTPILGQWHSVNMLQNVFNNILFYLRSSPSAGKVGSGIDYQMLQGLMNTGSMHELGQ